MRPTYSPAKGRSPVIVERCTALALEVVWWRTRSRRRARRGARERASLQPPRHFDSVTRSQKTFMSTRSAATDCTHQHSRCSMQPLMHCDKDTQFCDGKSCLTAMIQCGGRLCNYACASSLLSSAMRITLSCITPSISYWEQRRHGKRAHIYPHLSTSICSSCVAQYQHHRYSQAYLYCV